MVLVLRDYSMQLLFCQSLKWLHIGTNQAHVFDVDYFIQQLKGFIERLCSKHKRQFDYIENVLPSLLEHRYISITPAMSQRSDSFPLYAKAALCQACYSALRLTSTLEKKSFELLQAIPKLFLSLHLRFEPDMVAYSQCEYKGLSPASMEALEAARRDRKPWTGETARLWRNRGKSHSHQKKQPSFFNIFQSQQTPKD